LDLIEPNRCWTMIGGSKCGGELRLHIERSDIGSSYWWCPTCRQHSRADRHGLFRQCGSCRADSQGQPGGGQKGLAPSDLRMSLIPASTAYKPQTAAALDMPNADEDAALSEWRGLAVEDVEIAELLKALPEAARSDPVLVRQLKQHVAATRGSGERPVLADEASDQLRNFAGASAARTPGIDLDDDERAILGRDYAVQAQYLDGLAVLQMCFGYSVGSADPATAKLMLFPLAGGRYGVLTRRQTTEGILFQLDVERVRSWLRDDAQARDSDALKTRFLAAPAGDRAIGRVQTLLHSLSHILIRTSERHSGVSRDRLREILMPRFFSVLIYIDGGSELGMLRTSFEASMAPWLEGARQNAQRCAYDPVCGASDIRACHACLYLGERSCNTLWNTDLDRAVLVGRAGVAGLWG
jgi:hypothetical protein